MAQERVSPSGLHKYSMWLEEETASQEYWEKVKTVVKDEIYAVFITGFSTVNWLPPLPHGERAVVSQLLQFASA